MSEGGAVLLLGATGRTGGRVLNELLRRGVAVRALVRSAARLPDGVVSDPRLEVVETDVASLPADAWRRHLADVGATVCCLGHSMSLRGVLGPPRDLVEGAVRAVCAAAAARPTGSPLRLVLMSSVSVQRPAPADPRRGAGERAWVAAMRAVLPPARDNQRAADVLAVDQAIDPAAVEWVVVRPDTLVDGDASPYSVHEVLVASLFRPNTTRMANAARFMADLATDADLWSRWRGRMPVVVDADGSP